MTKHWRDLIGHREQVQWFTVAIAQGRLSGSLLFVGPDGVGKQTFAGLLARTLLCERVPAGQMRPCGECESCIQVDAHSHPDVVVVSKPPDRSTIPLELLIGRPELRSQEGFCRDVRLRPFRGARKMAIINDADYLNEEGANSLLKTLEEPPPNALIVLIGKSEQRQLPTIRSRCRTVRFAQTHLADAARLLREKHGIVADDERIASAVELAAGDIHVAARLLSGNDEAFIQSLRNQLAAKHIDPMGLCRMLTERVDAAGKEASPRRDAMRDIFSMAVQHYRHELRAAATNQHVSTQTLARLDRSIRALREVDRSANQSTLIECFAADIASAITGDRGEIG
jgi:DNA polymerase-3 subunit delta'